MEKHSQKEESVRNIAADTALRLALHCVRNTIIEDYHSQGKLSDKEMAAFNKEVVNKLYTFFLFSIDPKYANFYALFNLPYGWDKPCLDKHFMKSIKKK